MRAIRMRLASVPGGAITAPSSSHNARTRPRRSKPECAGRRRHEPRQDAQAVWRARTHCARLHRDDEWRHALRPCAVARGWETTHREASTTLARTASERTPTRRAWRIGLISARRLRHHRSRCTTCLIATSPATHTGARRSSATSRRAGRSFRRSPEWVAARIPSRRQCWTSFERRWRSQEQRAAGRRTP